MLALDVVERHVRGLGRHGIPEIARVFMLHHPGDCRVAHHAYAAGVGNQDRSFEQPALFDPVRSGHVAVAVTGEVAGEYAARTGFSKRQNRGDAGPDRSFSDHQLALAGDERFEPHLDTGDIRDRVQRSLRSVEGDAEIARARFLREGDRRERR